MNWQDVCEIPQLNDLPFKVELNGYGQIVMSPVKVDHSAFKGEIIRLLYALLHHGRVLVECAVKTPRGTKVADVAWLSEERYLLNRHKTECDIAPEICIEVVSFSNTAQEMEEKRALYVQQGAQEVWVCDERGNVRFYYGCEQHEHSSLVPDFPNKVRI